MRSIAFVVRPVVAAWALAGLLVACGGGPGGGASTPAPHTTLTVSPPSLALSVNDPLVSPALTGTPRTFEIKNIGTETVQSVIFAASARETMFSTTCTTLAPNATCTITVTPDDTPSAAPGDTSPVPITLSIGGIGGTTTNLLKPTVHVLTHGSVYQDGYVFAIDDTTPSNVSIDGKVAARDDSSTPSGIFWSAGAGGAIARDVVPGVSDDSTPPLPSCAGNADGKCNTEAIEFHYPATLLTEYAAGLCQDATFGTYIDWYLPSTCELSGSRGAVLCPASQQSIQTQLVDNLIAAGELPSANYWSSTQGSGVAAMDFAWGSLLQQTTGTSSLSNKDSLFRVRCVRELTY